MNVSTRFQTLSAVMGALFLLSACSETQLASHFAKKVNWPGQQPSQGSYKVGNPYKIGSDWYYPKEDMRHSETGIASWYGPTFHGKRTANGEIYDQNEMTAAHRTLPMPSLVRVTNLENGRAVVVRINDRGPFTKGRVIDLSQRAATLLGYIGRGTAKVRVEVMERESRQIAEAARRGMDVSRMTETDLNRMSIQPTDYREPIRVASADNSDISRMPTMANDATMLPDSLKTPTITVEELNAPRGMRPIPTPAPAPIPGHVEQGKFMPDPVVSQQPVVPTGMFVQVGAFGVRDNADRLKAQLASVGSVIVEPITANGKTLYRVKVGPFSTVEQADAALAKVIRAGNGGAKVIKAR